MSSKKDVLKSSGRLRRKKKFEAFLFFLCIVLFIVLSLAGLSQIDKLLIKKIKISGEKNISRDVLGGQIIKIISGRYLGLFPKNNFIIYKKNKIISSLESNFIKIKKAEVSLNEWNTLLVKIEERKPEMLWCENGSESCYYADGEGLIFDKAPNFSAGVFLQFEGKMPSGKPPSYYLGKNIFSKEYIKMLVTFKHRAEEIVKTVLKEDWRASRYVFGDGDDLELFFEDGNGSSWKIIISPRTEEGYSFKGDSGGGVLKSEKEMVWLGFGGDLEAAENNLKIILSSEAFVNSLEKSQRPLQHLEYIDLRFGKKIFYKFSK